MTATDTIPCDGCRNPTGDPTNCGHVELCPNCVKDTWCLDCLREEHEADLGDQARAEQKERL